MVNRLIVVTSLLPVERLEDGSWALDQQSTSVIKTLQKLRDLYPTIWIGCPYKQEISENEQSLMKEVFMKEFSCYPVFLERKLLEGFRNGFGHEILIQLFHYITQDMVFNNESWKCYQNANMEFARTIMEVIKDGDTIWIHDFHHLILPQYIKELADQLDIGNIEIGYFHHVPFPSSELYRALPVRKEVLYGMLHSDIVGFHTLDNCRHFLNSCSEILRVDTFPGGVEIDGRFVNVGVFPIGIDPEVLKSELGTDRLTDRIQQLESNFQNKKIILGVDRLDYTKGLPHKLEAFGSFLERYPEFRGQVILVQIILPCGYDEEINSDLNQTINGLVGEICSQFGTIEYIPIYIINNPVDLTQLAAFYSIADVFVVSSIRDGANLVAYEYVVCQERDPGVLVLSEFAGASHSLNGSIVVNPWSIDEMVEAYRTALTMSTETRVKSMNGMYQYVMKYTSEYWAKCFLEELRRAITERIYRNQELIKPKLTDIVMDGIKLYILDYDGVFALVKDNSGFSRPSVQVLDCISRLSEKKDVLVYIVSGKTRAILDEWFGCLNVGLVAEHGTFYKHRGKTSEWIECPGSCDVGWKSTILPILQRYTSLTPGSFIEEKDRGVTWNYENAETDFGDWQSSELQTILEKTLSHTPATMISRSKTLEWCPSITDKALTIKTILDDLKLTPPVQICLIGDGRTNDRLFSMLSKMEDTFTCSVKRRDTNARYHLNTVSEAFELIKSLV